MQTLKSIESGTSSSTVIKAAAACTLAFLLAGCSGFKATTSTPATIHGASFHGSLFGGRQPVSGAAITFYAASTAGYSAATTNILTTAVQTDPNGNFDITGDYTCTAGQQMYLVATGGDPGAGVNANAAFMAALGDCTNINAATYVSMNEITTVGSVFALAPFMSSYAALGSTSSNAAGLARAFASVNKLVNVGNGHSTGSALPANAIGPTNELNTLADVLAACVNSSGGTASNTTTSCGALFFYATPAGGTAPTDTIQAALNIAQNPTLNVANIYNVAPPTGPYQPQLAVTPTDWTMGIKYKSVGLNAPKSASIDAAGKIWFANSGNNSLTVLAQSGTPIAASPVTGNALATPVAVAIDASGNAWAANNTGNSLSVFTSSGAASATYTGGGTLNGPTAVAFDATGDAWVVNSTGKSLVEINPNGSYAGSTTINVSAPTAVAINPK